jgi:hypothetical protein
VDVGFQEGADYVSRRFERTVMNWRWWAIAPLFLLLLPIAVIAWAVEGMSDGVAKLTQALIAWRDRK